MPAVFWVTRETESSNVWVWLRPGRGKPKLSEVYGKFQQQGPDTEEYITLCLVEFKRAFGFLPGPGECIQVAFTAKPVSKKKAKSKAKAKKKPAKK